MGRMRFDKQFFEQILTSESVGRLCEEQANRVADIARSTAPVETGDYRDGIRVKRERVGDRVSGLVVGEDWKTLLVESTTGNLARAVRAVKR